MLKISENEKVEPTAYCVWVSSLIDGNIFLTTMSAPNALEEEGKQNMAHFLADSGVPAVAQESVLFGCEPIPEGTDEVHGYEFNNVSKVFHVQHF